MMPGALHEAAIAAPAIMALAPLAALPFALIWPRGGPAWSALVVATLCAALVVAFAVTPLAPQTLSQHADGAWGFSPTAIVAAPIAGVAVALIALASGAWAQSGQRAPAILYAAFGASAHGWIGALLASDLTLTFAHLQTGWFAACAVCALHGARDRAALSSALRMLQFGALAAALFALGAALFMRSAALDPFSADAAVQTPIGRGGAAGAALMILALCVYAGAAPLHGWTASVYARGGRLTGLLLGVVAPLSALTLAIRIFALGAGAPDGRLIMQIIVGGLGVAGVVWGSIQAIGARDLRRLAAYAAAAQAGCALVGLAAGSVAATAAAMLQLANLAIVALCILGGAAMIEGRATAVAVEGLGRRAPLAGAAIAAGALSLIGAPLTFGFLVRWRLIESALQSGLWWAAGVQIAASLAAVLYAGRVLERLYLRQAQSQLIPRTARRMALTPALAAAIAAVIWLGLDADPVWRAARFAGASLMDGAP